MEPEGQWLQKVSGSVNVTILTPETQEWSLEGKTFKLAIEVTATVAALKTLVQDKTGVPASKVKLCYEGLFLKDNFTLAYYNFSDDANVQLQVKERGGRKK